MYFKLVACYGSMLQLLFSSLFFRNFIVNKNKIGVEYQSFSVIDDTFVTFDLGLKSKLFVIIAQCFLNSFDASGDLSSSDNLCKQFGPRSGPTECRSLSGSKLFDTLIVFLKDFFEKVYFEKSAGALKHEKLPSMQGV